jgi:hypothetical protein
VGHVRRHRILAGRRDVDDSATLPGFDHLPGDGLAHQEVAVQVGAHNPPPFGVRQLQEGDTALHTGVVHQDVDAAELGHGLLDHPLDLRLVAGVGLHGDGAYIVGPRLGGDRLGSICALAVDNRHVRTAPRQPEHQRPADAPPATGHHGPLALQVDCHQPHLHTNPRLLPGEV